jgi:hypothetical protein
MFQSIPMSLSLQGNVGTWRKLYLEGLSIAIMNNRFSRLGLKSRPPFTSATVEDSCPVVCTPPGLVHADNSTSTKFIHDDEVEREEAAGNDTTTKDTSIQCEGVRAVTLSVTAPRGELKYGLQQAWIEIRRAQTYGFCKKEFELVKNSWLSQLQSAWLERDQENSSYLSDSIRQGFLTNSAIPAAGYDISLENTILRSVKLHELKPCLVVSVCVCAYVCLIK